MGIEPTTTAWKAVVLPLNYTRIYFMLYSQTLSHDFSFKLAFVEKSNILLNNLPLLYYTLFTKSSSRNCGFCRIFSAIKKSPM
jgi:hypothetical protein